MDFYVLDKGFQRVLIIDEYISAIWTKRYFSCGDFEIQMPASLDMIQAIHPDYYITRVDDDTVMIVEKIQITTDTDNGNTFTISGRSAESLLDRRVVYHKLYASNCNLAYLIRYILRYEFGEDVENPDREVKQIGELIENYDSRESIDCCPFAQSVYDVVFELCEAYGVGFRFTLSDAKLIPELYKGKNLSDSESGSDVVLFSPEYCNLLNSSYECDTSNFKTAAMVYVNNDTLSKTTSLFATRSKQFSGLERKEMAIDGSSVQNDEDIGETQYYGMLFLHGRQAVYAAGQSAAFTGDIDITTQFQYRRDWNIGDIVSIKNDYGIYAESRVLAVSEKDDATGYGVTPTFSEWEV